MLSSDPPDHTRLRRLVSAGLHGPAGGAARTADRPHRGRLLDDLAGVDEVDLIDSYAFLLPIQVICELLGIPSDDRDTFRFWSNTMVSGTFTTTDAKRAVALRVVVTEMVTYIRQLLVDKRRKPGEFSGVTIPAREPALISVLSANHDESAFAGADRLDVTRRDAAHLAFGHGIHFCLGAVLARLEGRVAIGALLERFPGLRLAVAPADLEWRTGILIRGLSRLPVRLKV